MGARRIADVTEHKPGIVDQPLIDISTMSPQRLDIVGRALRELFKPERVPVRNDILWRGALAHTDIALLLPERAAGYLQTGEGRERFVFDPFEKPRILYRRTAPLSGPTPRHGLRYTSLRWPILTTVTISRRSAIV